MKNPMNNQTAFAQMLRAFEADPRNPETLYQLSRVIAFSVLRKVIDPQRKAAADLETVSNSGYNPALVNLRRSIVSDTKTLVDLATATEKATHATYTADGDPVTLIADPTAEQAVAALIEETLGDGLDLVHAAAVALLEQAANHAAAGIGWTEKPYTVRKLSRRVYIQTADSAAWSDTETTPIQEAFKAVRREIQNSRALQTDPRNGYSYLEELTADPETGALDTLYIRMGKYADLGGYQTTDPIQTAGAPAGIDNSGSDLYTVDAAAVDGYNRMIENLNMTPRQTEIVRLRMQGYGYKAIASKLGVKPGAVQTQIMRLRDKCKALGYTPVDDTDTIAENLVSMLFRALEN